MASGEETRMTRWIERLDGVDPLQMNAGRMLREHGTFQRAGDIPHGHAAGAPRLCFANSQLLLIEDARSGAYRYAEGFGFDPQDRRSHPTLHGWLVDTAGAVVDVTWECTKEAVYYGMIFPTSFVYKALLRNGTGSLLFARTFDPPGVWEELERELTSTKRMIVRSAMEAHA